MKFFPLYTEHDTMDCDSFPTLAFNSRICRASYIRGMGLWLNILYKDMVQ